MDKNIWNAIMNYRKKFMRNAIVNYGYKYPVGMSYLDGSFDDGSFSDFRSSPSRLLLCLQ